MTNRFYLTFWGVMMVAALLVGTGIFVRLGRLNRTMEAVLKRLESTVK